LPTNQRYRQVLGSTATYVIIGAVDAVVDGPTGPCPGQVNMHLENPIAGQVNFCSSNFDGSTITFVAQALGCQITLVDYKVGVSGAGVDQFRTANNDIVADGVDDGTPNGGAGIQYVYATGEVVSCAVTTTQIHDPSHTPIVTALPGSIVHDKAVVTGTPGHGIPAGSVTFTFYANDPLHMCAVPPTAAGTVTLDASGVAHPSLAFGPLSAGEYSFRAKFKPDSGPYNDHGLAYSYSDCESLAITQTVLTTDIENPSGVSVTVAHIGDVVHDVMSVSLLPPSVIPSGSTVTFNIYNTADCTGAFSAQTVSIASGASSALASSSNVTLTAAGALSFLATFNSGNTNEVMSGTAACEPLTILTAPTGVTTQVHNAAHTDITNQSVPVGTAIHDSATVTGQVGAIPITGTVTYQFFTNGACTGTASTSQTVAVGTESSTQTPAAGSYSYLASYSGDANYSGATGVCEPVTIIATRSAAGGFTMGFWQNKNGQAIILGGASTGSVCNVGTWLRQFAPFQDLSATATCNAVATYVTNKIKAATAGGTSMNPMLKAQMLATALSVYFSDPALGGDKTGAPAPLGGVKIDLTNVSPVGDTTSVFNGSPSLTVLQILAYAASQSNVGGSSWYGQVKAKQELAKDVFDAINNNTALVAP
jgi:hypothetical protein